MRETTYQLLASVEAGLDGPFAFRGGTPAEAERLIRSIRFAVSELAEREIALAAGGGSPHTIAHLLAAGRLRLLEILRDTWSAASGGEGAPEAPPPLPPVTPETERDWIEIELLDPDGRPMPGELCKVKKTDGTTLQRALDGAGRLRIDAIPTGTCMISFPNLGASPAPSPTA